MTDYQILIGKVTKSSAVPTNPQPGDEFFDTDTNYWMRFDNVTWRGIEFTSSTTTSTSTRHNGA